MRHGHRRTESEHLNKGPRENKFKIKVAEEKEEEGITGLVEKSTRNNKVKTVYV